MRKILARRQRGAAIAAQVADFQHARHTQGADMGDAGVVVGVQMNRDKIVREFREGLKNPAVAKGLGEAFEVMKLDHEDPEATQ